MFRTKEPEQERYREEEERNVSHNPKVDQDCVLFIFECVIERAHSKKEYLKSKRVGNETKPIGRPNGPIAQPVRAHA